MIKKKKTGLNNKLLCEVHQIKITAWFYSNFVTSEDFKDKKYFLFNTFDNLVLSNTFS